VLNLHKDARKRYMLSSVRRVSWIVRC